MTELSSRIQNIRFTTVNLREGYDIGEVDEFLDRIVVEDRAGRPIGSLVQDARFAKVRFRSAYDIDEVDRFLAGLVGLQVRGLDAVANPTTTTGSVIEERPGLFRRLFRR